LPLSVCCTHTSAFQFLPGSLLCRYVTPDVLEGRREARKGKIQYKETNKRRKAYKALQRRIRIRKGEILKQKESRINLEKIKYYKKIEKRVRKGKAQKNKKR
jgi:hypothetical protein